MQKQLCGAEARLNESKSGQSCWFESMMYCRCEPGMQPWPSWVCTSLKYKSWQLSGHSQHVRFLCTCSSNLIRASEFLWYDKMSVCTKWWPKVSYQQEWKVWWKGVWTCYQTFNNSLNKESNIQMSKLKRKDWFVSTLVSVIMVNAVNNSLPVG